MKTLFVEKKSMELRYERACLLIYHEGKRISSVPLAQLERIVVAPHVALTAGVLGLVAEKEVALLVVNHRYPERTALLSGSSKTDVQRRMVQYQVHQDAGFRLHWSVYLVRLKTIRQMRFLLSMRQRRPDLRLALSHALSGIKTILNDLETSGSVTSLASLRGKEGAAAALYFKAFTGLFAPELQFTGRNRRPPKDPVNVCLSLAYTLFYHEAGNALKTAGLDPALGCFHEIYYSRQSFSCDLLEPLRPLIDTWIYDLFQQRVMRVEDFVFDGDCCVLQASGKNRFYTAVRDKTHAFRRLLRRYAQFSADIICQYECPSC